MSRHLFTKVFSSHFPIADNAHGYLFLCTDRCRLFRACDTAFITERVDKILACAHYGKPTGTYLLLQCHRPSQAQPSERNGNEDVREIPRWFRGSLTPDVSVTRVYD